MKPVAERCPKLQRVAEEIASSDLNRTCYQTGRIFVSTSTVYHVLELLEGLGLRVVPERTSV